jgi:hypothetical protein
MKFPECRLLMPRNGGDQSSIDVVAGRREPFAG